MEPKVGEYWYISTNVKHGYMSYQDHTFLARCVAVKDKEPLFIGSLGFIYDGFFKSLYGPNHYSRIIDYKWEPNWFWKLLGYK